MNKWARHQRVPGYDQRNTTPYYDRENRCRCCGELDTENEDRICDDCRETIEAARQIGLIP